MSFFLSQERQNKREVISILHSVLSICSVMGRAIHAPAEELLPGFRAFFEREAELREKDPLLYHFVYALSCDFFATVGEHVVPFSEMATAAYAQAITLFLDNQAEFKVLQQHYRAIVDNAQSYRGRLCNFLVRVIADEHFVTRPTSNEWSVAIKELSENLHLLDERSKTFASEFLAAVAAIPSGQLLNNWQIENQARRLHIVLTSDNDLGEEDHLIDRMREMTINASAAQPLPRPWLIHDLLTTDNVPKFIKGLADTLPLTLEDGQGLKRLLLGSSAEGYADDQAQDDAEIFQRRIVHARRHVERGDPMVPQRRASEPSPDEEALDDTDAESLAKRLRMTFGGMQ